MELIKFKRPTYIRKGPGKAYEVLGIVFPSGKDFAVDGEENGEDLDGINNWYYKKNGKGQKQYYWKGGTVTVESNISWGIRALGIDQLWPETLGEGVKVAIIDTGIDLKNDDLKAAYKTGYNVLTQQCYPQDPTCIQDYDGHGTGCATVLGSRGTLDFRGIAPACELIIIKMAEDHDHVDPVKNLPDAVDKAILLGADIISISSGFYPEDKAVTAMINKSSAEAIIIAAAGNDGTYVAYPANIPGMISVGAVKINNSELGYKEGAFAIATYSTKGISDSTHEGITIVAPGENIFTYNANGGKMLFRGTSCAAPYVAGIVTLILSYQRKYPSGKPFTQQDIRNAIIATAYHVDQATDTTEWGNGIIDPVALFSTFKK